MDEEADAAGGRRRRSFQAGREGPCRVVLARLWLGAWSNTVEEYRERHEHELGSQSG